MRNFKLVGLCLALLLLPLAVYAQSATLNGTVTDPSGAVVTGAKVQVQDVSTGTTYTQTTSANGAYTFSNLKPGTYKLTVSAKGFKTSTIPSVQVDVGKIQAANVKLQLGEVTQTVEVTSIGQTLQTADASIGNVLNEASLQSLPSLSRDATALLQLQPMSSPAYNSAPGTGEGDVTGGQVAGSLADQNTFKVDGGDATSNTEADGNYNTGAGTPRAVVPTPVESLEGARVVTNNSNTFARSAGAEVELVTRRGSNAWHGALYEYNQNTDYNANLWQLNNQVDPVTGKWSPKPRPIWQDNRFGGRLGGPLWKDRAFFFIMYEGRRFKKASPFTRLVPSALLRQGIIQLPDGAGNIVQYNLASGAPTAVCAGGACDPRGKGMSPVISQIWNQFMPQGNNPSEGDGLNTIGFDSSVPITTREDDGIARFDFSLTKNWDLMASSRYAVSDEFGNQQVDIGGLTGGTLGVPHSTRENPLQPRYTVLGLTGRITPNLTNAFHFDWLRHWWQWRATDPFPQVSGLGAALQIFSESNTNGLVPMNVDTQNARSRVWNGHDYNFNDEVSWIRGGHVVQFGGSARHQHFFHVRNDKVVGALTAPVYFAEKSSFVNIGAAFRPAVCAGPGSTNCIQDADTSRWDSLYASVLGMIDHGSQLLTRNANLDPNAPGTPNTQNTMVDWYDLHLVDTWRIRPTLTLSYGLDWGVQTPPYETRGLQTVMTYADSGKEVLYQDYLKNLMQAALQGQAYAPTLAFNPVRTVSRKYPYDPDWHNFAPRFSLAWNPGFSGGLLGRMFGDRKSSIRAGYGRYYDRINGVGIVMTPALGIGFGDTVNCRGPLATGVCSGAKVDPTTGFRIGVDGNTLALPSLTPITPPVVPGLSSKGKPLVPGANSPYETLDFRINPHRKVGVEDTWNLSIQRQVSNSTIVEFGYVGRVAHHLYGAYDLNQVPYMLTKGGQTFGSAFDAVQKYISSGGNPTAVPAQPFFENVLAGQCAGFASCTEMLVDPSDPLGVASYFPNRDVVDMFDTISPVPLPLDQQYLIQQITASDGNSNYNAGYVSVRKQAGHGLTFQANYTLSHSRDDVGLGQQYVFISPSDAFNRRKDYQNSFFDRRHTVTGFFVYELPFGPGHLLASSGWLSKLIGGWQLSSSITASSGLPLAMLGDGNCEELGDGYGENCAYMVPINGGHFKVKANYQPLQPGTPRSVNAFGDPSAIQAAFREPTFSDPRMGGNPIRGFSRWNVDSGLTKTTKVTERFSFSLSMYAVNVFNHMEFVDPSLGLFNTTTFGDVSTQYNSPRFLNIGLRVDF